MRLTYLVSGTLLNNNWVAQIEDVTGVAEEMLAAVDQGFV